MVLFFATFLGCGKYKYEFSSSSPRNVNEGFQSEHLILGEDAGIVIIPFYLHHKSIKEGSVTVGTGALKLGAVEGKDFRIVEVKVREERPSVLRYDIYLEIIQNIKEDSDRFFQLEVFGKNFSPKYNRSIRIFITDDDSHPQPLFVADPQPTQLGRITFGAEADIFQSVYMRSSKSLYSCDRANNIIYKTEASDRVFIDEGNFLQKNVAEFGQLSGITTDGNTILATFDKGPRNKGMAVIFDQDMAVMDKVELGYSPINPIYSEVNGFFAIPCAGFPDSLYSYDPVGEVFFLRLDKKENKITASGALGIAGLNLNRRDMSEKGIRIMGPFATIAQDLEPQSVDFSADGKSIFVNFQENNGYLHWDLEKDSLVDFYSYGMIDHSENKAGFDAQPYLPSPIIAKWPVNSLLQPDGICVCNIRGKDYILTANEGKGRTYPVYNEKSSLESLNLRAFGDDIEKLSQYNDSLLLGNLIVSSVDGDDNLDGFVDRWIKFGSRSMSVFDPEKGEMIYDSGESIERWIANDAGWRQIFNADANSNELKSTSLGKGVKPKKVICRPYGGRNLAFVTLNTFGGVAIFDVSQPEQTKMVGYINSRHQRTYAGDYGSEGIYFWERQDNPFQRDVLVISNSASGSLVFYAL